MRCPRCRHENPRGSRFCNRCGARAEAPSPDAYTPRHLVAKILSSRTALEGERKPVTVLFCDIAGSTSLAERLGPDAMHGFLNRFFELTLAEVHRYEGTINQFLGDGFMALFGAPLAHEDHARRAVLAALSIHRVIHEHAARLELPAGEALAVRMGLNTGLVVVGRIGDNLRMDYTAVGDTTNLAARLQQAAEPGAILVSEATDRQVRGYVRVDALAPIQVKGKAEAVRAYKVLGVGPRRSPMDVRWARPLSRFVGRDAELNLLADLSSQAEHGRGQVVGIVGEPGVGKSRLLYEFRLALGGRRITYFEGRCLSYGTSTPYLPVLDVIRSNCGITDSDPPEAVAPKVHFGLQEVGMDPAEGAPYVLHLLGMKEGAERLAVLPPDVIRARTLEILKQMALQGSQRRPIIFALEDLQWIDRPSEEYFASLVDSLESAPILVLTTYRPGYRPPWIERSTQLALRPLSRSDGLRVIHSVVQPEGLSEQLGETILQKAEGNPFFLEELARAVAEHAHLRSPVAIPDTIQGVLMARIDRLPDEAKRVLQTASVIGRDVSLRLLQATGESAGRLDADLAELKRHEFLYEQTGTGEPAYSFTHALTQEVAYESLLHERRRSLHARVTEAIERLAEGRLPEHAETLAHHAVRGEVWDKAVDYLREAGARAYVRGALQESLERFEQALQIVARLPESPEHMRRGIDARLDLHAPLFVRGELSRLADLHREAERLARQLEDQPRLGRVAYRMANYAWLDAQYSRGIAYGGEALQIAEAMNDPELRIWANWVLAVIHYALGTYDTAIDFLTSMLEGLDTDSPPGRFGASFGSPYIVGCGWLTFSLTAVGDFERARRHADDGLQAADRGGHPLAQAFASTWRGLVPMATGDFDQALSWLERALTLCETNGLLLWLPAASSAWGWALSWSGRVADGLPYLERAATVWESIGTKVQLSWFYFRWAEGLFLAGHIPDGQAIAQKALQLTLALGERGHQADTLRLLADMAAAGKDLDRETAVGLYERGRALAVELGMRPLVARCHLGLGRVHGRTGNRRQAHEHLTTAVRMFREMDMRFWREQAEAELKDLG